MEARFIQLNNNIEIPTFYVDDNRKIVNFGENNDIPQLLLKYYESVGLNRAIIDRKKKMFMGKGLTFDMQDDNLSKKTLQFLNEINAFENIDKLFDKIGVDLFLYGGTYLQIIWSKDGKKITAIYHMPYHKMRSGVANKFGFVEKFYYNMSDKKFEQWGKFTDGTEKYIEEFDAFNTSKNKSKAQILYIKQYDPSNIYYAMPDYIGALKDLDTMAAISDFHNANIHNNMQPGSLIFFKGPEPDNDKKDAIVKAIKTKYSDTQNAGKPMVFFVEGDVEPTIEQANTSNIGDMYKNLSEDVKENITVSHQIPRAVAGLMSPGSLGNTKEMLEGVEIVYSQYIQPIQEFVLNYFNEIMAINGLKDIYFTNPSANLIKFTISELATVLTQDELRDYLGYEPINAETTEEKIEKDIENNE